MKICVLAQRIPYPPNKGEKLRTFHQIEYMRQWGHEVTVLSFRHTADDDQHAAQLQEKLGVEVQLFDLGSLPLRYARALLSGAPMSAGAFYSKSAVAALQQQATQADVLFLAASSLVPYVQPLAQKLPIMIDFMDVDSDKWRQYAEAESLSMRWVYQREMRLVRELERWGCENARACFLIAAEEVALFARNVSAAKPVHVLGNGMAFDSFYPPENVPSLAEPLFLFTGVMDYKPNVDAVVWFVEHCWAGIKKVLPHARFVIAGMNPNRQVLALADEEGVEVTGFVDDILPYYHEAAVFVAPFRLARGVQNKVLQAAACGVPIVTTSMGAEGIAFSGEATMAIADSALAFSRACISAVQDATASRERALRALAAIRQDYGWPQQLAPLKAALERL